MAIDKVEKLGKHLREVEAEVRRASSIYPPFSSLHEGYAILLEEVEELWDEIKKSPRKRDAAKIKEEATQVAAMATRFLVDLTSLMEL